VCRRLALAEHEPEGVCGVMTLLVDVSRRVVLVIAAVVVDCVPIVIF
jgi:hypothetical protein